MATSVLTAAERQRWQRWPETMPPDDRAVSFLLSDDATREVHRQRAPCTRLGDALPLGARRYLGCGPTDVTATPEVVVTFVAAQRAVAPRGLALYDQRAPPSAHRRHGRTYVGVRPAPPMEGDAVQPWRLARARDHDPPTLRLPWASAKRSRERLVRPGVPRLARCVATARAQAHEETWRQGTPLLSDERPTWLDGLLQPDATTGRTLRSWLRHAASSHAASPSMATRTTIVVLHDAGVAPWHRASLTPHRAQWFAPLGGQSPHQALQRLAPARRSPGRGACLPPALLHHPAIAVARFAPGGWGCHSEAQPELEACRTAVARSTHDKLKRLRDLGTGLRDDDIEDAEGRAVRFDRGPTKALHDAIDETPGGMRPRPEAAIAVCGQRYNHLPPAERVV